MTITLIIIAIACIAIMAATVSLLHWAVRTAHHDRVGEVVRPQPAVARKRRAPVAHPQRRRADARRLSGQAG